MYRILLLLFSLGLVCGNTWNPIAQNLNYLEWNLYTPTDAVCDLASNIKCTQIGEFPYQFDLESQNYTHYYCSMRFSGSIRVFSPYPVMLSPLNYTGPFASDEFYSYTYVFVGQTYAINLNTVNYYAKRKDNNPPLWDLTVVSVGIHPDQTILRLGLDVRSHPGGSEILLDLEIEYNT